MKPDDGKVTEKILTGCTNRSCTITGSRKGMVTNGGCNCVWIALLLSRDNAYAEQVRRELESLLRSLWSRIEADES